MAEDSTLLLRLLEERVTQRRVVVREKKESDVSEKKEKKESEKESEKEEKKEVSEKEKEEVKENEESESEKEAEAFTEEQKAYLDALVKAIEAKNVEEVRVRVCASFDK